MLAPSYVSSWTTPRHLLSLPPNQTTAAPLFVLLHETNKQVMSSHPQLEQSTTTPLTTISLLNYMLVWPASGQ
jgi:hypothetical protein